MKKRRIPIYILPVLFAILTGFDSQAQHLITWHRPFTESLSESGSGRKWLNCVSCYNNEQTGLPVYVFYPEGNFNSLPELQLDSLNFAALTPEELIAFNQCDVSEWSGRLEYDAAILYDRGKGICQISIIPFRINELNGEVEKLISFGLKIKESPERESRGEQERHYASSSVLASGDWFKIAVKNTGIYKITYSDLQMMGVPVQSISPAGIRIHGYGGGMLPERAGIPRYDDLPEIAVRVVDGGDGKLDPGDYILFYGRGPMAWKYNGQATRFEHTAHLYSDESYYFLTYGASAGRRITELPQPQSGNPAIVEVYNYYDVHHPNEMNLIKSGKEWFGDIFDLISSRDYNFKPFVADATRPVGIRLSAAARSTSVSTFTLSAADKSFQLYIPSIDLIFNTNFARMATESFEIPFDGAFKGVNLKYTQPVSTATGWLNYIEINALAKLEFNGGQLSFRRTGLQDVVEYRISTRAAPDQIWDVTDPLNPGLIKPFSSSGTAGFRALADTLREYITSDAASYLKPEFVEKVPNQNLHSMTSADMIIISHPLFTDQAVRLATFHSQHNDFSVNLVYPQDIYNEFSSGAQDISAIRDFMKMLWHKGGENNRPRFLLLFGDASYDYKNRIPGNTNKVPTFQSPESLHPVTSYATDDFFGCIDDNEGGLTTDVMDIGVGRLVVNTPEEAKMAVDKIIHYATDYEKVHGDWRNEIAFVADDEDGNDHMRQADQLATMIDTTYPNYNVNKIFLDAYPQISTPGGQRAPEVNKAINMQVDKGALIVNYTGHGGETGWALERILEIVDINSWTNYSRMPVFVTATCEFSRYDDPERASGGELVFLNPKGGGIALFTTARPTFGPPNFNLVRNFYRLALSPDENGMLFMGDLIRISKRVSGADNNSKKFVLLGDPALKMAYPRYNVLTTEVNGRQVNGEADTLRALGEVTIRGIIADDSRNVLSNFNGVVTATVYDKESLINTLGSDGSQTMSFSLRRNIIYKGKVIVENGHFSFSFIVPKDIAYQYGSGKISFYATNGEVDAAGNYRDIVIGGISNEIFEDANGPEIELFMNNTDFRSGGFTDENPVLLALMSDISGINTLGNGIGHDIVAILDGKTDNPFVLNEYYHSDLNTYKSGKVVFPFSKLSPGMHTLRLKAWDILNNSSTATITFNVASSKEMLLGSLEAYPNPMNDHTKLVFEHNQAGQTLDLTLNIFSLSGTKVATLNRTIFAEGFRSSAFEWDGRNSYGRELTPGIYIGHLQVKTGSGLQSAKSVKIAIVR